MVFDPTSGPGGHSTQTIYVGSTDRGDSHLFRSTDAGQSWQPVPGQPANLLAIHAAFDMQGMLYVVYGNGVGPDGVTDGAVWRLNPRDGSWTDITPVKDANRFPGGYGGLGVDLQHPGTLVVASLDRKNPNLPPREDDDDRIYRTTNGGQSWTDISSKSHRDASASPYVAWAGVYDAKAEKPEPSIGWWIDTLAIDPFDSNHVCYATGARTVPAGGVISQDPAAGTVVLSGSPVNLAVSGIAVPNIVGQTLAAGETAIVAGNLTVGNVTLAASAAVPAGSIVSENPPGRHVRGCRGAGGYRVVGIAIPNVAGEAQNAAEAGITGAGLAVGNVTQAGSTVVAAGAVMSESPAAGTVVLPGTAVHLVVSTGSSGQTTVPNVVGLTQVRATTAIQDVGLVAGTVTTATSATVAAGNVISESPAAGSLVNAGSAVNLVVSVGLTLLSIGVTPVNPSIVPGGTEQFTATGAYGGNITHDLTSQVTWGSAVTGVATINGLGLATGGAVGASTISATLGTVSGSTVLTVTDLAQCAANPHGSYTVADAKVMINQALGVSPPANDLKGNGAVNVADAQIAVNAAMGLGCTAH